MEFRKELKIKAFRSQLSVLDKLMLIGSCFSENLGEKLRSFRFDVQINPSGTLFNPVSICRALESYIDKKNYSQDDLFFHEELWKSWDHHSLFAHPDREVALSNINEMVTSAHQTLLEAQWLIITLGSAWVYEKEDGRVVANCHKVPTDKFFKRLLPASEISADFRNLHQRLKQVNPNLKIIYTISPVRHIRDGFVENNRSKAALIQAVHELIDSTDYSAMYFPAYELIIDDLRDYRFYAEDMVHPNYLATDYVWDKFVNACIDERSRRFFPEIGQLNAAKAHKPFQPMSVAHQKFREKHYQLAEKLRGEWPQLDWQSDLNFFRHQ